MNKYIVSPNLPQGEISKVICGTKDKSVLDFFADKGIEVLSLKPNRYIDRSISSHADISALHLGGNKIIVDIAQNELSGVLKATGMSVFTTQEPVCGKYPSDVKLNFSIFGDYAVGNFKYADVNLVSLLSDKKLINVRQGYCNCSTLVINESSIITDDESIHRKILENGVNSLLVTKGDILLDGHEYGFIGGASFKLGRDTVVFFGNIEKHRDCKKIKEFINAQGCSVVCTDEGSLRDIGGVVGICEK